MLQAYYAGRMDDVAVFEFFVRALPRGWGYLVAAGLEQVLQYLERGPVTWRASLARRRRLPSRCTACRPTALDAAHDYPVAVSDGVRVLAAEVDLWIAAHAACR